MKKIIAMMMALLLAAMVISCGSNANTTTSGESQETKAPEETTTEKEETTKQEETTKETEPEKSSDEETEEQQPAEGVMTYAEFLAAEMDDEVTVECYVMDHQSWWDNKITVYARDVDGPYFLYNMACSEEDAEKLTQGTKILVKGYKSEWSGEIEIIDATFEIVEGDEFGFSPLDITHLFSSDPDALSEKMNDYFTVTDAVVAASKDGDGNEVPFLYNYDGSGSQGDDLYFNVDIDGKVYTFTVESYLRGKDTDIYQAVENMKIGDHMDFDGYLYWYNGPNPHIIKAFETEADHDKQQMKYVEYFYQAAVDDEVTMKLYVQDHQSWWDGKITVYAYTSRGPVFVYNMACSEEDAEKLVPGTQIIVTGYKGEWSGEVEIVDATFEFGSDNTYIAEPENLTELFEENPDDLVDWQNYKFTVEGAEIVASKDADGKGVPYLYSYDGSGTEGDDLYFNVKIGNNEYTFTVESYLRGKDTDVYKAVQNFNIGDKVDLGGFLYWYNGVNPHITECTPAK